MAKRNSGAGVTEYEKGMIFALLKRNYTNQQTQYYINIGRDKTINAARIAEVKSGIPIHAAEFVGDWAGHLIDEFLFKKNNYDFKTGLNPVDDERIIRAREAMCSAVHIFNSPTHFFKIQSFVIFANIAWTYLVHEHCVRENVSIIRKDEKTESLNDLIKQQKIPLSSGIKNNLEALKKIRDAVEHEGIGIQFESRYNAIFQACCLNFEKMLVAWFGKKCSLQQELSMALQFAKHDIHSVAELQKNDVPPNIAALDARVYGKLTEEQLNDLEYQFKVVYTQKAASKGGSDIAVQFVNPASAEGKAIHNILVKKTYADKDYPFKPKSVCKAVEKALGKPYSIHTHTQAYKKYKVRPVGNKVPAESEIDGTYCIYHPLYKCYSYNKAWVDLLIKEEQAKA